MLTNRYASRMRLATLAGLIFAVGCTSSPPQVLTGRIDRGFPAAITTVKVTTSSIQSWKGDAVVTTAQVAADGTFRVEVPALTGVRIQLLGPDGKSMVVFPRHDGTINRAFRIQPNGASFDLGAIRFVGDAAAARYAYKTSASGSPSCDANGEDANGDMCVDDSDNNNDTCGQNESGDQAGDQTGDQTGDHQDGSADPADGSDMGDAVAEHNFPADGCSDDGGQDGNQGGEGDQGGGTD